MTSHSTLKVFIQNCSVLLRVGVNEHEKQAPQRILITVEAETSLKRAYHDKNNADLNTVIDYSRLHKFITQKLPQQDHIPLLETIAQQIVDFCFEDTRINRIYIRLSKPDIYQDTEAAGIELMLTRQEHATMEQS